MRDFDPDVEDGEDWPVEDDESSDVLPCPECGAEVYEDAQWCPACGQFIVHRTSPWIGRPWWWVALGLAGIAAVVWLMMPGW